METQIALHSVVHRVSHQIPPESETSRQNRTTPVGNRSLSRVGVGKICVLPIRVPNPSPTLDENLASMDPGILSSIGVGVWRKAPEAFLDSNTTLDTCQPARPPKSRCRTFLRTPPSHFPVSLAAGRVPERGVSQRAGGGYRGTFGFRKRIALHQPVVLHCATKAQNCNPPTLTEPRPTNRPLGILPRTHLKNPPGVLIPPLNKVY